MDATERLALAVSVVRKLGKHRAVEYGTPQVPPIANPLGVGYTGVDKTGRYRARIGVCSALEGSNLRVSLGSYRDPERAAFAYRIAHTALYGSYSWAAEALIAEEIVLIKKTRAAC